MRFVVTAVRTFQWLIVRHYLFTRHAGLLNGFLGICQEVVGLSYRRDVAKG